jgi:hypothetical protein
LDLRIKIKKQVMGLVDKLVKQQPQSDPNQLNTSELQLVLSLLKQSSIKGEQVELFYNLVLKLQNQFISLSKEN